METRREIAITVGILVLILAIGVVLTLLAPQHPLGGAPTNVPTTG